MGDNLFDAIDEKIHAKARLGIMSLLTVQGECDFGTLKQELQLTEGNLGNHIRVLENAGYIQVTKTFTGKRPKTLCSATELGIQAFRDYIEQLERIIRMTQLPKS
ncbi:winged helix-turn-helix domain-containing protein [Cohnella nanjingensis]|uniref:Transcriptional regulator n=1 Tax=Cohnella nanjingensis TaxID=1387779 RepID=A0A7X0RS82_9BACL|nr:transcriptional regulator [Cohnella nanjingensis]MBB6672732.1 transcriptional regulator [Cohnella nanjingensis]